MQRKICEIKKYKKEFLLSIAGFLQGTFGSYLALLGVAFAFPISSIGDKDYEEDMLFVPFGYIIIFIWLAVMIITFISLRKKKAKLLSFFISWLIGVVVWLIFCIDIFNFL